MWGPVRAAALGPPPAAERRLSPPQRRGLRGPGALRQGSPGRAGASAGAGRGGQGPGSRRRGAVRDGIAGLRDPRGRGVVPAGRRAGRRPELGGPTQDAGAAGLAGDPQTFSRSAGSWALGEQTGRKTLGTKDPFWQHGERHPRTETGTCASGVPRTAPGPPSPPGAHRTGQRGRGTYQRGQDAPALLVGAALGEDARVRAEQQRGRQHPARGPGGAGEERAPSAPPAPPAPRARRPRHGHPGPPPPPAPGARVPAPRPAGEGARGRGRAGGALGGGRGVWRPQPARLRAPTRVRALGALPRRLAPTPARA